MWRRFSLLLGLTAGLFGPPAWSYEAEIHQQLTFIAAHQYNRCMEAAELPQRLSALDTRHIVKANTAQADANLFVRMFRWPYYNRADQQNRTSIWVIDTRFHDHFESLLARMQRADKRRHSLRDLGRMINYIQVVTSPAHAVPVFTGRWWRFSMGDKFDRFPPDLEALRAALDGRCEALMNPPADYHTLLAETAGDTLTDVRSPIEGFPTTWAAYWRPAQEADEFGEYGRAGNNFGERTAFRCGDQERCLLLDNDPLYAEFAMRRHLAAILATMRAMQLYQPVSTQPLGED